MSLSAFPTVTGGSAEQTGASEDPVGPVRHTKSAFLGPAVSWSATRTLRVQSGWSAIVADSVGHLVTMTTTVLAIKTVLLKDYVSPFASQTVSDANAERTDAVDLVVPVR